MRCTIVLLALASVTCIGLTFAQAPDEYETCDSQIFCVGDLLRTIQMARLKVDSKTFVDMKLKVSPLTTMNNFRTWQLANPTPTIPAIRQFVADNFEPEGSEMVPWSPTDFTPNPKFLQLIADPTYRAFASSLNTKWSQLGRRMTDDVARHPELYSIIHVPNPVIVPGGRFREFYYWDSYWIVLGLLHSEMHTTVKGMLDNFLSIVDRFGFIPNGGRIYYMGRSQPPLLIPMVNEYLTATNDLEFVRAAMPTMEREFEYWFKTNKTVKVKGFTLSRYTDRSRGPRPEAFWEDSEQANMINSETDREEYYVEMKAAAESGMDFTTRWFIKEGSNNGTLVDLKCRSIVPVELNAVLYWNAKLLGDFHERLGNPAKAAEYWARALVMYHAIQTVFWHEDVGAWLDWDLVNSQRRDYFVPTNLSPLWVGAFNRSDAARLSEKVLAYVALNNLDVYPAGVPNTLMQSGEQWDFPNVWPPMQHILITGLANLGTKEADDLALSWASKWVFTNWVGFNKTDAMYEKYSATVIGLGGRGGEYEVQLGFGWSNGVVLDLLKKYGDRLTPKSAATSHVSLGVIATFCVGLMTRWLH